MLALIRDVAPTIPVPPELVGPVAGLILALAVAGILWREHLRADAEDRKQRDDMFAINEKLRDIIAWQADAISKDTRDRAGRRRADDA